MVPNFQQLINNLVWIPSNTGWHQCQVVYHIAGFQDSFQDGQAAEKNLSKQYGITHHLLTKTTLVGSHQNKRHVTRSYVATPRVAARTATFQCCYYSTISISVSNWFRGLPFLHLFEIPAFSVLRQIRGFASATSQPTSTTTWFFRRYSPLSYCSTDFYQLFTVLLLLVIYRPAKSHALGVWHTHL